MNPVDTVPIMLLALHMLALGIGTIMFIGMIVLHRRERARQGRLQDGGVLTSPAVKFTHCPPVWLAVRSSSPEAIQAALGVSDSVPCPWTEGISGKHEFFIGSPVKDWIIVTGSGLPQPGQDVDRCFHFLIRLSRRLGHVQFFIVDPVLKYHAWVRAENGTVKRAYVWVNETLWNQGAKSLAEIELNLKCFAYGEDPGLDNATIEEIAASNVQKVPLLAARWSFNPAAVAANAPSSAEGVAGKSSRFCKD